MTARPHRQLDHLRRRGRGLSAGRPLRLSGMAVTVRQREWRAVTLDRRAANGSREGGGKRFPRGPATAARTRINTRWPSPPCQTVVERGTGVEGLDEPCLALRCGAHAGWRRPDCRRFGAAAATSDPERRRRRARSCRARGFADPAATIAAETFSTLLVGSASCSSGCECHAQGHRFLAVGHFALALEQVESTSTPRDQRPCRATCAPQHRRRSPPCGSTSSVKAAGKQVPAALRPGASVRLCRTSPWRRGSGMAPRRARGATSGPSTDPVLFRPNPGAVRQTSRCWSAQLHVRRGRIRPDRPSATKAVDRGRYVEHHPGRPSGVE